MNIHTTAEEVLAELRRHGMGPATPVTITIEPEPGLLKKARTLSRVRVEALGLSDADIDALIAQARKEVSSETV